MAVAVQQHLAEREVVDRRKAERIWVNWMVNGTTWGEKKRKKKNNATMEMWSSGEVG